MCVRTSVCIVGIAGDHGVTERYRFGMTTASTTMLHGSVPMPMHGLGVLRTKDGDEVRNAVTLAIEHGCLLVDSAAIYENDSGVGQALAGSGITREDIFVTDKLWNTEQGREASLPAMSASLGRLAMEYVDLYLILRQLQSGNATIPKSVKKHRIHENGDVFGFSLIKG